MKTNNKILMSILLVIVATIVSTVVFATPSTVRVINFHYENINGEETVTVTNSGTVLGYYPDYNFQPNNGYTLKILDNSNNALFSVKMLPPSEIYVHEYDGKNISGGLVILNQTDFSMTLPTFQNESKIVILNSNNQNVMDYAIPEQKTQETGKTSVPFGIIIAFVLILLVFVLAGRLRKKKKEIR